MSFKQRALVGVFGVVVFTAFTAVIAGQNRSSDYTQWRGPNRDGGAAASFAAPTAWPERLTQKWKVPMGLGYATPLVVGNRIYLFSRQGDNEVMSALDPDNGKVIWETGYPATVSINAAAGETR